MYKMSTCTKHLLFCLISLFCLHTQAQTLQDEVRQYRTKNEPAILKQYMEFLSIPNVTKDSSNILRNAHYIADWMQQLGISTELLRGKDPMGNPCVMGRVTVPGATRTLAFYAHYDGQPVNPKQWYPGLQPFEPVFITAPMERGGQLIKDQLNFNNIDPSWRISGRGSADDKAGVMTILRAYEALIRTGQPLKNNLLFLFEGEEEIGSEHIGEIFDQHKDKLQAAVWMIADGPRHVSGKKMVNFGVRGDVNMSLTVYGAKRPLHSGNYGNWAPNPARMLVELLAGMKDEKNLVTIPGFYEDVVPLSPIEKKAIAAIPKVEEQLKQELGILSPEGDGLPFLELLHLPTLNINGIQSANVGAMAANVIPVKAEAAIDLRLVLGNDVQRQVNKVKNYITAKGYHIIDHEPTDAERMQFSKLIKISIGKGYNAQRTPMDLPIAQEILRTVQSTAKEPIVALPSAGGSLPLIIFEEKLQAKVITIPVVNYDNNQHAENENMRIDFLWEGIETMAALMMMGK